MRTIEQHFIDALRSGGLKLISELVFKNPDKYVLCIRKNYINIYYKGHNLFNVKDENGSYKIQFDFNHAKYIAMPEYKKLCDELLGLGAILDFNKKQYGIKTFDVNENNHFNLDKIAEVYTKIIESFFDKHNKLEKIRQQEYFSEYCKYVSNGIMFYDRESAVEETDIISAFGCDKSLGQPDFMAVKIENDVVRKIVFIEIKSTSSACGSISRDKKTKERKITKSGVLKHNMDFDVLLSNDKLKNQMIKQMKKTISIYCDLGYITAPAIKYAEEISFDKLFVFTDGAKTWAEAKSNRLCEDRDCYKQLKADNKTVLEGESLWKE